MAISDLENALITWRLEARIMLEKMWVLLITLSMISGITGRLLFSGKYGIPRDRTWIC